MGFFKKLLGTPEGSVFIKVAGADAKLVEARGRIVAADAANLAHHEAIEHFEHESARIHAESDHVHARVDAVLATL